MSCVRGLVMERHRKWTQAGKDCGAGRKGTEKIFITVAIPVVVGSL